MLSKDTTSSIVRKYGKNEKDTGCAEVQIALLSARIKDLTAHLKKNPQDAAARRSLFLLVGKRRGLLSYLMNNDSEAYAKLIAELGLRK